MAQIQLKELCTLHAELAQLKQERDELIKIAGAALVLVNDMDENTFESFEAAELVASYINHLPEPVLEETMRFAWA